MNINGLIEHGIYVDDVARSAAFYEKLFGFRRLVSDDRFCALAIPGTTVLLLFKKGGTLKPTVLPGGVLPQHDGSGQTHFAFKISAADLAACERELAENGVAIESTMHWPRGGTSLYFRDPDRHLLELITPGCWEIY